MKDFDELTLSQLKQLHVRISKEIDKRASNTKADLLKRMRKLAEQEGVTLEDLLGVAAVDAPAKAKGARRRREATLAPDQKAPLPLKYRNPDNPAQGWSGRGRKPGWVVAWLANGGALSALEHTGVLKKSRRHAPAPAEIAPAIVASDIDAAPATASPDASAEAT